MLKKANFVLVFIGILIGITFCIVYAQSTEEKSDKKEKVISDFSVTQWIEQSKKLEMDISEWKDLKVFFSNYKLVSMSNEEKTDLLVKLQGFVLEANRQTGIVNEEAVDMAIRLLKTIPPDNYSHCRLIFCDAFFGVGFNHQEILKKLEKGSSSLPENLKKMFIVTRIYSGDRNAIADLITNVINNKEYSNLSLFTEQLISKLISKKIKKRAGLPEDYSDKDLLEFSEWLRKNPVCVIFKYDKGFMGVFYDLP